MKVFIIWTNPALQRFFQQILESCAISERILPYKHYYYCVLRVVHHLKESCHTNNITTGCASFERILLQKYFLTESWALGIIRKNPAIQTILLQVWELCIIWKNPAFLIFLWLSLESFSSFERMLLYKHFIYLSLENCASFERIYKPYCYRILCSVHVLKESWFTNLFTIESQWLFIIWKNNAILTFLLLSR